jgi:hypothetical protein
MPCTAADCTKGAWIAGIVAQQSCSSMPCDEQSIEVQHCIAASRVVEASQSNP